MAFVSGVHSECLPAWHARALQTNHGAPAYPFLESRVAPRAKIKNSVARATSGSVQLKAKKRVCGVCSRISHAEGSAAGSFDSSSATEDPVMAAAGILPFHCSSTVAGAPELQLQSEAEALAQLARVAGDWQMELLTAGPVSVLGRFDVVARCPASGDTEEQQPLNEEAQAALRAFELLQPKRQKPKSKPPDSAGPGPSEEKQPRQKKSRKKAKSQSALKLLEKKKLQGMLQLDSESESALMPEDESASEDAPPAREIPLLEETSDQGDGPVASSSSSARDAGAQASSQVSALHAPGGIFFISPLYRSGQQVGWEALCNLHSDQHDKQGTSCKKSISQTTGVSAAECKLRLKRWLVAGLDDAKWGEDCKRSTHISLGGALLRQYAAGLSEAELDAKAKHVG